MEEPHIILQKLQLSLKYLTFLQILPPPLGEISLLSPHPVEKMKPFIVGALRGADDF